MAAYDVERWHELFVMMGGAAAALAGLIFVAVSLNLEQILAYPKLPRLAARTLSLLVSVLLLSALGLAPQPTRAYGAEVLAAGLVLAVIVLAASPRESDDPLLWGVVTVGLALLASVPAVVAGGSLLVGRGGGLYWLLAEFVLGTAVAAYWAWILLIEIRR